MAMHNSLIGLCISAPSSRNILSILYFPGNKGSSRPSRRLGSCVAARSAQEGNPQSLVLLAPNSAGYDQIASHNFGRVTPDLYTVSGSHQIPSVCLGDFRGGFLSPDFPPVVA